MFPIFAFGLVLSGAFLVVLLVWLEERDLRRTYALFGTTGFGDIDYRFRMEEADRLDYQLLAASHQFRRI